MKKFLEDWQRFWRDLDANQKVSLVLAAGAVLVAVVALLFWAQRPQMRLLYGSVAEKDAAAIVAHLESQGIPYEIRSGGSAIYVPEKMVYQARMDVVSQGIIKGDSVGFEIFDKTSFGVSDFIQRTNFIRAVQGELSRTIAQLRGVNSARVMVVIPDNRLLLVNSDVQTTASVFVDVGGGSLSPAAVQSIQALVANAVEGLTASNVAVVDNHGNVLSVERDRDALMAASTGVMEYRQAMERYLGDKVESMLERVVGRGNTVVRVAADIDAEMISRVEERFDEGSQVVRSQSTQEETRSIVGGTAGDIVSMELTQATEGNPNNPSRTDEEKRNRDQQFEIDRTVTNIVRNPGSIRRLSASVFVAARLQADGTGEDAEWIPVNRTPEELAVLREMVANALGIDLADPQSGSVTVQEMVFASDPLLGMGNKAFAGSFDISEWLQFGQELVGTLIALVLFLVFFQMYRKSRLQPSPFDELNQRLASASRANTPAAPVVTPELLNELIRQKPENVGTTLRNWLSGKAAEKS